jgi:Putative adhesin
MATRTIDSPERLTFDEPVTRLDVYLIAGRLNVVGTDGPARVEIANAGRKPITIEQRDGRLSVRHERIPKWPGFLWWLTGMGRRFRVDVSIAVPASARADLQLVEGSVIASGLREDTKVVVTSGRITLMGLGGHTAAKLVSGPVEALGVAGELTMETISGELILADSPAERVHAHTVSGAITCDLDNPRHSEIRLGTTSGSVTVRVREDSDLTVHMHTTSGQITSAFPELRTEEVLSWAKDVQGVLGAGEGRLWATSTSGSIALLSRPVDLS